jgi:hypothetical protein
MKLDKHLGNITPYGDSLLIEPKKLWRWYHDSLSGYLSADAVKRRHEHDIVIKDKGGSKTIRVPIFSMGDMGKDMAIDEKQIGEEMHTILSNRHTGKIALLAQSISAKELINLLPKFNFKGLPLQKSSIF